ncbi:MAG: ribonuclease HI family protein [Bacillati bacterium ANGP1]|uniref:Ribonuclease HI family protein n=1 Tax=Candidatus Segetimicrobium genomatis TaxID=2569760 RepID=A0A537IY79_9BACT|nr:MAG: ribonuclease HI family protein [Terrabacteria group bacterium ANGP1]
MSPSSKHLVLVVDGASRGNPGPSAIGIVIKDAKGKVLKEIGEYIGEFTNNVAEYRALLRALEEAKTMGAGSVEVRSDSDLLVSQLQGSYKVKSPDLGPLYLDAIRLLRGFSRYTVTKIPRGENAAADAVANRSLDQAFPESSLEFSALLEKEDKLYVVRVPAFGVKGYGATRSEALEMARDEVIERIRELRTQGKALPQEERIRVRITSDDVR